VEAIGTTSISPWIEREVLRAGLSGVHFRRKKKTGRVIIEQHGKEWVPLKDQVFHKDRGKEWLS